jgi:GTPase SAR1 family protein
MSNGGTENLFDVKYKVLLLGDTLVGKTSLQRFIAGKDFRTDIGATIGVDFVNKIIPIEQSKINLQIW